MRCNRTFGVLVLFFRATGCTSKEGLGGRLYHSKQDVFLLCGPFQYIILKRLKY
jgi:hypothetical protein